MVLLDSYIAGCVHTWLGNKGQLDDKRQRILRSCLDDLERVLPLLRAGEREYYVRLRRLAQLALT